MRKSVFLLLLVALTNSLSAQDEDFPFRKADVGDNMKQLIGRQNGSIVLWKTFGDMQTIDWYDTTDLHLVNSAELIIPQDADEVTSLQKIAIIGNVLKVVVEGHSTDFTNYAFHVYDFGEHGIISGSGITIPVVNVGMAKRGIAIVKTNQEQNCLLLGWISTDKKRTSRNVEFSVLDEHSKIIHTRNHLEWGEFDRHVYKWCDLEVNNRKQVLLKVVREERIRGVSNDLLIVRSFSSQDQQEPVVSTLPLPKGMVVKEWFLTENDQYCRFFITYQSYSNRYGMTGIQGMYNCSVDADGSLSPAKYSTYSGKTRLKTLAGATDLNKAVPEYYTITDAIIDNEGNTYLLQERRMLAAIHGLFSNTVVGYDWYYGSVLITKFSPEGTQLWDNLVIKSQKFYMSNSTLPILPERQQEGMVEISYDDEHLLSYNASLENNQLKLVFNDLPENCDWNEKKERTYYKTPDSGIPFVVLVSPVDGSHTYQCHEDLRMTVAPYQFQYALNYNGWLYAPCKGQGQNQLVKVHY